MVLSRPALALLLFALPAVFASAAEEPTPVHGVAMHGAPKYGPDFRHFDYVNPDAPKGGTVIFSAIGTFDSLNPYILKGVPAAGLGLVFQTLTVQSQDEPFSEYAEIAESILVPEDRSWVAFDLRPQARWHDGRPITVEDVIFSFDTLKSKGHPFYRAYYRNVVKAEKIGERRVRFLFEGGTNRELPLIVGQLPVLPKHYYEGRDFERATLDAPLGSGPYRVERVDAGRTIVYRRVTDWWGADLPVNRGRYNFDEIRYEYYRDSDVALEAFKAGQYDIRLENTAKLWATGYDSPALERGWIVKEEIPVEQPAGMQGFVFNTRREIFRDRRVRAALAYAFDFEWTNRTLFYGAYTRTDSYFENSELEAEGLPGPAELALLEPFRDRLPAEVFTRRYEPPKTDGSGNLREQLRTALRMLREAGWDVRDGRLVQLASGMPMRFEILLVNPAFERIVGPFVQNLARLGIEASVRTVDTAQYENRVNQFDFDMIVGVWGQSLSPGNEQRDFWSCEAANTPGSRNWAGVCDPVVDALIDRIIGAPSREELVAACRALDRVLLWGHYVIPHWHIPYLRVAYWNKFGRPAVLPRHDLDLFAWWVDPAKLAALQAARGAGR
ncbi:Oligopeptide-binding protein AppA [bacterium HR40]|nr:Oligopeptide-binding protein AppA [bacterium HR40]